MYGPCEFIHLQGYPSYFAYTNTHSQATPALYSMLLGELISD